MQRFGIRHVAVRAAACAVLVLAALLAGCATGSTAPADGAPEIETEPAADEELRRIAGQLVVAGFEEAEITPEFEAFLRDNYIGNVILFRWNVADVRQLRSLCADIQRIVQETTGLPALICMDQEGGRVNRFREDVVALPGAAEFAAHGSPELVRRAAELTALQMRLCGVNTDLAPVVDVNNNPDNPVIGTRSYGDTVETVVAYSTGMIQGLRDGGVLSTAKHFPGHGDTDVDSHVGLPVIHKTYDQLKAFELVPFQNAIASGVPIIMTAHILFPAIDPELPATLSPRILTDILRGDLQFDGVIISDALEMKAIKDRWGKVNGAAMAIRAGADMLCVIAGDAEAAEACAAVARDVPPERLREAYGRVAALKAAQGGLLLAPELDDDAFAAELARLNARMAEVRAEVTSLVAAE